MSCKFVGTAVAALAILALAPCAHAAEMKAGGTFSGSEVYQEVHPLDSADHLLISQVAKGMHKSPGSPLDGAAFQVSETVAIDKGNGPEFGQFSLVNEKGSLTNELHGTVKTVMVGGQPHTTLTGSYRMIGGTGMFAGGSGHGTYTVTFTSQKDFSGEYKGVLSIPKMQAQR